MNSFASNSNRASIRIAAVVVVAFGIGGCSAPSSVSSLLGTVSGAADLVSAGAKVAFFTEGLGGMATLGVMTSDPLGPGGIPTLGIDIEAMETAIEVMDAADDVSDIAGTAAEDAALAEEILDPLLNPPTAAD